MDSSHYDSYGCMILDPYLLLLSSVSIVLSGGRRWQRWRQLAPRLVQGPGKRGGNLKVVGGGQVAVEVEEGLGLIATDGALLGLACAEVHRVDVSRQGTWNRETGTKER